VTDDGDPIDPDALDEVLARLGWDGQIELVDPTIAAAESIVEPPALSRRLLPVCQNVARVGWVKSRTELMSLGVWPQFVR
jgi:hypothetical protein